MKTFHKRDGCEILYFACATSHRFAFDSLCDLMHQLNQLKVCDKFAAMLQNEVRTSDPRCDHGTQCHDIHHALTSRLCFPRYLPVIDSGKGTGEKEVVLVAQTIYDESVDARLTSNETPKAARSPSQLA